MKKYFLFLCFILFSNFLNAQTSESFINTINRPNRWVDSVFKSMTKKEKIGQLFMIRAHTNRGAAYSDSVAQIIKKEQLGGVVFFQGGPQRQAVLTNQYQSLVKTPLMAAMDGEWGLAMRLDSTTAYPFQMTLGAIQDNKLIYKMGQYIAADFKRIGMHINFAPVMDVNNNPKNPVINYRSFGDNKFAVAEKGIAYMNGMQHSGVFTTAKHFPGHGDTNVDSHYDLPQLNFSKERLDTLEMYPFKKAVEAGLSGVMVAHMNIPSLDNTPNLPSTLSKPIVTDILKDKIGFKGLIFSDAMDMKGVVKFFPNGEADLKALMAGVDVIELSEDSERAIKLVRKAIRKRQFTKAELNAKVRKILEAKYWMNLYKYQPVDTLNLINDLNTEEAKVLIQEIADNAVTVVKGVEYFPLKKDFVRKTAIVNVGVKEATLFSNMLKNADSQVSVFNIPKDITLADLEKTKADLKKFDQLILTVYDVRARPFGTIDYNSNLKVFIADVAKLNTITMVFANPYIIDGLPGIEKSKALVLGYQNMKEIQTAAAKIMLGQLKSKGKLPVTINAMFKTGYGL